MRESGNSLLTLNNTEDGFKKDIEAIIEPWSTSGKLDLSSEQKQTPKPAALPRPVFWEHKQSTRPVVMSALLFTPELKQPTVKTQPRDDNELKQQAELLRIVTEGNIPRPVFTKTESEVKSAVVISPLLKVKLEELDQIIKIIRVSPPTDERKHALLCSLAQVSEVVAKENEFSHPALGLVANKLRNMLFKQHEKVLSAVTVDELLRLAGNWYVFLKTDHGGYFQITTAVIGNIPESQILQKICDIEESTPTIAESRAKIIRMQDYWVSAFNPDPTEHKIINSAAKNFCDAVIGNELAMIRDVIPDAEGNRRGHLRGLHLPLLQNYFKDIILSGVDVRHPSLIPAPADAPVSPLQASSLFKANTINLTILIADIKTSKLRDTLWAAFEGNETTLIDETTHSNAIKKVLAKAYFDLADMYDNNAAVDHDTLTKLIQLMYGSIPITNQTDIVNADFIVRYKEIRAVSRNKVTDTVRNADAEEPAICRGLTH